MATSPRSALRLTPFECDPLLRSIARRGGRAYLALPMVLGSLIVVNALQGTLGHPEWPGIWVSDALHVLGISVQQDVTPWFPLMRDTVSLSVTIVLALHIAVLHRQWRIVGGVLVDLHASAAITFPGTANRVQAAVERLNRLFRIVGYLSPIFALIAIATAFTVLRAQSDGGVFLGFAPRGIGREAQLAWASQAYDGWWAAASTNRLGFATFTIIAAAFIYYVIVQNIVGLALVGFVAINSPLISFRANRLNPDGVYGWKPLGNLLTTVYASLSAHATSLLFLIVVLRAGIHTSLIPLLATIIVVGPVYLMAPVLLLRRPLRRFRELEAAALLQRHTEAVRKIDDPTELARLERFTREELEEIRRVTAFPFRKGRIALLSLYVIPLGVALTELITTFR